MKKINFKAVAVFFVGAMMLSSCASLQKMKKNADKINYTVTPEVLVAKGGNVDVEIQGRIPEKYFNKKATITATPVLTYQGGEKAYAPYKLQGEKVEANNKVISYSTGGTFSYKGSVPYVDGMRKSDLVVRITASQGDQTLDFDPVKIADGVIATSTLVKDKPATIVGVQKEKNTTGVYDPTIDKFQRIVPDEYKADLMYLINSAYVRGSQLKKEDMDKLNQYIKDAFQEDNKDLKGVMVSAYASPDGPEKFNTKLAERREGTATKVVDRKLKKDKVETEVKGKYTPEDWAGFKELMEKSNIQDKEMILRVLSMYQDPEVREREIKNLSGPFQEIAKTILPKLRRSKIIASVDLIGKTDEQISNLADNDPSKLNQAELIYAASLTSDLNKQKAIYTSFTRQFPEDWRGYNDLGVVEMNQGNTSDAQANFEKADKLDPNNPIIQNNLGGVALVNGNLDKAQQLFSGASGAGQEVNYNLGTVSIMKGDYDAAVKYFGDEASVNKALAQMLSGDNNGALRTLNNLKNETALADYLKAIIGARTAKTTLLYDSLKAAVNKDAQYKDIAKVDLEFSKYFNDEQFKSIVE
jgi:tetratricopeptide (TPR) repeat protein